MIEWDDTPKITLRWAGMTFSELADRQFQAVYGREFLEGILFVMQRDVQAELSHLGPDDDVPETLVIRNAKLVGLVTLTPIGEGTYQVSIRMVTEAEAEAASSA